MCVTGMRVMEPKKRGRRKKAAVQDDVKKPVRTNVASTNADDSKVVAADVDVDNVFCLMTIADKVKIPARRLDADFGSFVLEVLHARYVSVCSRHGYIRDGQMRLLQVSDPIVRLSHLNADSYCDVQFQAWVCRPTVGACMRGTVARTNQFGVLIHAGPIHCVVARKPVSSMLASAVDIDSVEINDVVVFRVHGVQYEVGNTIISVVGTIESDSTCMEAQIRAIKSAHSLRGDVGPGVDMVDADEKDVEPDGRDEDEEEQEEQDEEEKEEEEEEEDRVSGEDPSVDGSESDDDNDDNDDDTYSNNDDNEPGEFWA
jgi:DNA-directed RNA polymerase subunit E'/Rpb7